MKLLNNDIDFEKIDEWILERVKKNVSQKKINHSYGERYVKYRLKKQFKSISCDFIYDRHDIRFHFICKLQQIYYGRLNISNTIDTATKIYNNNNEILLKKFRTIINKFHMLHTINTTMINKVATNFKQIIDIDNKYNENENENENDELPELETFNEIINIDKKKMEETIDLEIINSIQNGFNTDMTNFNSIVYEISDIYNKLQYNYKYLHQVQSIVEYLKKLRDAKTKHINEPDNINIEEMVNSVLEIKNTEEN
jgi:hypothetical protein